MILFTSGTSGQPKGAILTHGSIRAAARNAAEALALRPDDVVLGAAPFSHVLGQSTGLVSTFLAGAAVEVVPRFEPSRRSRRWRRRGRACSSASRRCASPSPGGARRRRAAADPDRPRRRRGRSRRGGARVRAHLRRRGHRGLRPDRASGIATTYAVGAAAEARLGRDAARRHRDPDRRRPTSAASARCSSAAPRSIPGYWDDPEATARRSTPTAGSPRETWATWTTRATSSSSTGRRR